MLHKIWWPYWKELIMSFQMSGLNSLVNIVIVSYWQIEFLLKSSGKGPQNFQKFFGMVRGWGRPKIFAPKIFKNFGVLRGTIFEKKFGSPIFAIAWRTERHQKNYRKMLMKFSSRIFVTEGRTKFLRTVCAAK